MSYMFETDGDEFVAYARDQVLMLFLHCITKHIKKLKSSIFPLYFTIHTESNIQAGNENGTDYQ